MKRFILSLVLAGAALVPTAQSTVMASDWYGGSSYGWSGYGSVPRFDYGYGAYDHGRYSHHDGYYGGYGHGWSNYPRYGHDRYGQGGYTHGGFGGWGHAVHHW